MSGNVTIHDGDRLFVWYRPGLCQDWLRKKNERARQREDAPVAAERGGFGR